jgi:predicted GNAT superfamily acetyltransferase
LPIASSAKSADIQIRHCSGLAEYEECVRIQRLTWGDDLIVPSGLSRVAQRTGGQVLGAFDGSQMVGFTLAFAGMRSGEVFLHSHQTAVLPEYRDAGVGRRLKLFQRQDALKRGIKLVEWTFDPLELKNAYFNLVRLGAIARVLIPNCYGITGSALHAGLPTDRLVAEWWLDSERVKSILAGIALPPPDSTRCISLPSNIREIKSADPADGVRIQSGAREQFQKWFASGYAATAIEQLDETTEYILEPTNAIAGLSLPASEEH